MNFAKITLSVALLGALTLGMADDTATQSNNTNSGIDAQITKIQNAPAQERVQLMNQFKEQLANMNVQERTDAIAQMQEKMQGQAQSNMKAGQDMGEEMHKNAQDTKDHAQEMGEDMHQMTEDMIQEHQAHAMQHMDQTQRTNQMQAGDHMNHIDQMEHQNNQTQNNDFSNRH
ncbi:hypothetical protein [Sulfurimonas sp.]|uniref:hypothetical protein n=1 Tax=Sulfurimonas sp. TaxID=2022749 RepID=UPI002608E80B|nr:hypothetical protein [Sulfurimonas sp.]